MSTSSWPARVRAAPIVIPPGAHDPVFRMLVDEWGGWQFRFGVQRDSHHGLQLWAPTSSVSLLRVMEEEPRASYLAGGWHVLVASESMVRALLFEDLGVALPSHARILAVERWHLRVTLDDARWELAVHRPDA